jgi:hypothetical protein
LTITYQTDKSLKYSENPGDQKRLQGQKVDTIDRGRIVFGKAIIPVGNKYKEKFEDYLRKNFL